MAFSQSIKKETLEPFEDFPAFLVRRLAGCRQRREDPGGLILGSFFLVVLGYMACNLSSRFPSLCPCYVVEW